jgi:hypothetical protein
MVRRSKIIAIAKDLAQRFVAADMVLSWLFLAKKNPSQKLAAKLALRPPQARHTEQKMVKRKPN